MDSHWSSRQTFERYLYDYLVKRNMHHTAEVFRNETNLHLGPAASSTDAVDVPEGFLLEWWSLNNDFEYFRQMHEKRGLFRGMQGCNAFPEVGSSMNVRPKYQFPNNFTPVKALNIGSNLMPSRVTGEWPVFSSSSAHHKGSGKLPQCLFPFSHQEAFGQMQRLSSSHQDKVMTPVEKTTEVSNVNSSEANSGFIEETDPIIENLLNSFWLFEPDEPSLFDKSTVGQSSTNAESLVERGIGNTSMNTIAGSPLEEDDNTSDTSDSSSSFQFVLTDEDVSTDPQLESNAET
ncbi:uncharacterized protein LOC114187045 isoform X2 [Vigna unguiculata]|uniref:uncharacterized protein LOC114187045 isoform X2 n=1 Tax=Vigna unguiculata TaxID=3917 RepID=UPI0010171C71|nr:uncharacterized protein LOC114187045 isoform X2 [Vigna unguiculata]